MEDYTNQNLKKFPKVTFRSLNCSNNKLRYIPNNLQLNTFYFTYNRVKRLPNLLLVEHLGSANNKIKDRSYRIFMCSYNKYYNYLCNLDGYYEN